MPKDEQAPKTRFFYQNDAFEASTLAGVSIVQPKMLPPFFRERTRIWQKFYIFLIVIFMALAVGVTAYVMFNGLAEKYGLTSTTQSTHLIFTFVLWFVAIVGVAFFVWWSRRRSYLVDGVSVIAVVIPPLILSLIALVYFLRTDIGVLITESKNLFLVLGLTALISTGISLLIVTLSNMFSTRGYREAKYRSFYTLPGLLVLSAAPLVLWGTSQANNFITFEVGEIVYPLLALFGGAVLVVLGATMSYRYKPQEVQLASRYVQISSSLSSILIFLTLFIVGLSFASSGEFTTPLIGALVIDFVFVLSFIAFIFLRGRIKNIVTTNPLFNELIVKGLLVIIASVGLIFIAVTSELVNNASYAPTTFGLLAITGFACFAIVTIAHFANLVVFEKFAKTLFVGSLIALAAILVIAFVFGSLPTGNVFINIFAVGIAITLIIAPLIIECAILIVAILTIETEVVRDNITSRLTRRKAAAKAASAKTARLNLAPEQQVNKGA